VDGEFFSWDGGIFTKEIGGIKELNQQIVHGDTRNMLQLVYLQHMAGRELHTTATDVG